MAKVTYDFAINVAGFAMKNPGVSCSKFPMSLESVTKHVRKKS